jgi:Iron-containing redox enzyme
MPSARIEPLVQYIRHARSAAPVDLSDPRVLTRNLLFLHDCVVATQPLMLDAAVMAMMKRGDGYCGALARYYREHCEEEAGHLQWLQDDMAALGIVPNDPPDPLAMAMIGTQYYLLKHMHPATLLGYFAVAEGEPTSLDLVAELERIHGIAGMTFIRQHAISDLEHRHDVHHMIDAAPESLMPAIRLSAHNVLGYYAFAAQAWRMADGD